MVYILCILHKRSTQYVEILEIFLNSSIALERMKAYNVGRAYGRATIINKKVTREG
jgi:hypothetical protein